MLETDMLFNLKFKKNVYIQPISKHQILVKMTQNKENNNFLSSVNII